MDALQDKSPDPLETALANKKKGLVIKIDVSPEGALSHDVAGPAEMTSPAIEDTEKEQMEAKQNLADFNGNQKMMNDASQDKQMIHDELSKLNLPIAKKHKMKK